MNEQPFPWQYHLFLQKNDKENITWMCKSKQNNYIDHIVVDGVYNPIGLSCIVESNSQQQVKDCQTHLCENGIASLA